MNNGATTELNFEAAADYFRESPETAEAYIELRSQAEAMHDTIVEFTPEQQSEIRDHIREILAIAESSEL